MFLNPKLYLALLILPCIARLTPLWDRYETAIMITVGVLFLAAVITGNIQQHKQWKREEYSPFIDHEPHTMD